MLARGPGRALRLDAAMFLIAPYIQALGCLPIALQAWAHWQGGVAGWLSWALNLVIAYTAAAGAAALTVTLDGRWSAKSARAVLMFPFFMLSFIPLNVLAVCQVWARRPIAWEAIPHARAMEIRRIP
jgi:hypothetical protein